MVEGIGYGKTILFGEMFAIFGVPVIASALSMTAEVEVVQTDPEAGKLKMNAGRPKGIKKKKRRCRSNPWNESSNTCVSVRNISGFCSVESFQP